jgi:hypothetical protein
MRPRSLVVLLLTSLLGIASASLVNAAEGWWNDSWPYRVQVNASGGEGVVEVSLDFGAQFDALGLNHALLDIRSLRVVPVFANGQAGEPLPLAETYSRMLENAENPQIDGGSGVYWRVNDGEAEADSTRFTQGAGSLKARVDNLPGGYGYPGVELLIGSGSPLRDWSAYEVLVYDVWPEVNDSARDQAPDLYSFKLYGACGGSSITQGGPPLALNRWNGASVSLNPIDSCWDKDGRDLSNISRMEFHTRDNDTVNGNSGQWDDGDTLTLWFDNMRLVDQDNGAIRWQSVAGVSRYDLYFDTLYHEGRPGGVTDETLGSATISGSAQPAEAGGYYHLIQGATLPSGLTAWAAPSTEKILRTMSAPSVSAPLRISAARGEFEPFQIVLRSDSAQTLTATASSFAKGADVIPAPTLHRVDYVNITTAGNHFDRFGLWPDPLWPLHNGDAIDLPAGENQPLWWTLHVPWDAAPGVYQGTVTVGGAVLPVELKVWDFELPRTIHLDSEWGFSWTPIVEIYGGTVGGSVQDCYWDVVNALKQDFIDHRLIPKGVAWPAGVNYPGGIEYDCNGLLEPDAWGMWDFATLGGRYIKGQDGFNDGQGFPTFVALGPRSTWPPDSLPFSFCGISREGYLGSTEYQAKWTQYLSALDAYLVSADYADAAYYHIVNEPQTDDDYIICGEISAMTRAAAPHLRQLLSEQVEPAVYNYPGAKIDIWMPTISTYEVMKSWDRQKNHDEEVWWYFLYGDDPPLPNPIFICSHGLEARLIPWLAWAERVDGLLHYSVTDWSENPWETPNVTGQDNGDAFLFYPPRKDNTDLDSCGENGHRLVPSIRWENLRDGMEDYEYLWLIAGGDPQVGVENPADAFVRQVALSRTLFSRSPADCAAVREAMGDQLGGGGPESGGSFWATR